MSLRAATVPVTSFQQNRSVLWCDVTRRRAVVDRGGNDDDLTHSIRDNLFPLGNDVRLVPGHGSMSNFGPEKQINPNVVDRLFKS